jgi:lipoate-protein ligase B
VWVEGRKLGSIGIAVKRKIAMHGLALNVDLCLRPYDWINPCGLENVSMTSLAREAGRKIAIPRVKEELKHNMADIFKVRQRILDANELYRILNGL